MLKWILVLICCLPGKLLAEPSPLVIAEGDNWFNLATYAEVLEDPEKQFTLESIQTGEISKGFAPIDKEVPSYGMKGYAYWIRAKLKNDQDIPETWVLGIEYAVLDNIDLYLVKRNGETIHKQSGDHSPFHQREIKNRQFYFYIMMEPQAEMMLYLRVQTEGAAEIPMYLMSQDRYAARDHEDQFLRGLFAGLLGVMFLYNLLIGVGSHNKDYFFIALFIGVFLLFKGSLDGITTEYLWPEMTWWSSQAGAFLTPAVYVCALLCGYVFLPLKDYSNIRKVFLSLIILSCFMSLSSFFLPYRIIAISMVIGMSSVVAMALFAFYFYLKGFKPARYFLVAWITLILGAVASGTQKMGLIPVSFFTTNGMEIGAVLQALFLSLGQSDKIKEINRAIRAAKEEALQAQIQTNKINESMKQKLEVLVKVRTRRIRAIMDNVKSGFLLVGPNLKLQDGITRSCNMIFEREITPGLDFCELFELDKRSQDNLSLALDQVFDNKLPPAVTLQQIPQKLKVSGKILRIDGAEVLSEHGNIESILFTISDNTSLEQAQQEAQENSSLLSIAKNKFAFRSFIHEALREIEKAMEDAQMTEAKGVQTKLKLMLHTMKGNFAAFGLNEISVLLHKIEGRPVVQLVDLGDVDKAIKSYLEKHQSVLGFSYQTLDQEVYRVPEEQLQSLQEEMLRYAPNSAISDKFSDWVHQVRCVPAIDLLRHIQEDAYRMAGNLGKEVQFDITGGEILVNHRRFKKVFQNLVHLIRNSIDHGIERPVDRGAKAKVGHISLSISATKDYLTIVCQDDGIGIDETKIKQRLVDLKILTADEASKKSSEEIQDYIFKNEFSTESEVSHYSGRGAGMTSFKSSVDELGGTIMVSSQAQKGTKFRVIMPLLEEVLLERSSA